MNTIVHKELIERKRKLQQITVSLKEHFIGLDGVIDEVISLMMPWYLFPEAQLRPTIINFSASCGDAQT